MQNLIQNKKQTDTRKNAQRYERIFSAVMIDFRYQIARRDIQCNTACQRQCISNRKTDILTDKINKKDTQKRCQTDKRSSDQNFLKTFSGGDDHRTDGKTFGKFM